MRLESERHAATSLRDALLPTAPDLTTPGLAVRGLCRSPAGSGRVAGDWFDVLTVDECSFLVVGDVAGSGLAATTTAIQLRSAIRAYAVHGLTPGELLTGLNKMLCELDPDRLATITIADLSPRDRKLRWAAAGQAKPVRYAATGDGFVLDGHVGVPIGALSDATYSDTELELAPGDRVLVYTDGLLSRRDSPVTDGLDVLLHAGFEVDLDDIEALVDHVNEKLGSEPYDDLCLITAAVL
jgi:serine phosphatase RsbU (regulator of sigma subunit)